MLEIQVWNSGLGLRFGILDWDSGFGIRLGTKVGDSYLGFLFEIQD